MILLVLNYLIELIEKFPKQIQENLKGITGSFLSKAETSLEEE